MNPATWWNERNPREQLILALAATILVFLLMYLALEPVLQERSRMQDSLPQLRTDLLWMKQNAAKLKSLQPGAGSNASNTAAKVSLSVVQSLVNELSLQGRLKDLGQGPGQSIRIQFEEITFPELMNFLYRIKSTTAANINSAEISSAGDQQGVVHASIVLGG
jgi:type II secretory pathway component PulM